MLPRLFLAAKKVKYMDFPFYMYVIRQNSIMTSRVTGKKVQMSIEIYRDWFDLFAKISDNEYQRYLFGALIKYYLANCRHMKISGWEIQGLDFKFSFKYALNLKEKLKVLMFFLLPELYINI